MWAGTLAILDEPADDPLETEIERGVGGIEVEESYQYLDGERVQSGIIAGRVPNHEERVHIAHQVETAEAEVQTEQQEVTL